MNLLNYLLVEKQFNLLVFICTNLLKIRLIDIFRKLAATEKRCFGQLRRSLVGSRTNQTLAAERPIPGGGGMGDLAGRVHKMQDHLIHHLLAVFIAMLSESGL
jgi:hypothetical protein